MNKLSLNLPLNNLSFGFVSINLLREFCKLGLNPSIEPIGNVDLSSFEGVIEQPFIDWLQKAANNFQAKHKRNIPTFKLWHIQSSLSSNSEKQYLYTFHELDQLTEFEINVLNNQEGVMVSNDFSKKVFEVNGVDNTVRIPLGFDKDSFFKTERPAYDDDKIITFGVFGKFEARKNTELVVKTLCKLYGNNPKYRIHCQIFNPFLGRNAQEIEENNKRVCAMLTENGKYFNVNFFPYFKTNRELNSLINSVDVVVDGSGGEAWSFGAFHALGIGKHAVLHNTTGIKEWANEENSVLIAPNGKKPAADGMFFHQGAPYNQGNVFTFDPSALENALKLAEERVRKNRINEAGLELQKKFTWENTAKQILEAIKVN